jgi:hypothetical protein
MDVIFGALNSLATKSTKTHDKRTAVAAIMIFCYTLNETETGAQALPHL